MKVVLVGQSDWVTSRTDDLTRLLGNEGAKALTRGLDALIWCRTHKPTWLLTELHLPDLNGAFLWQSLQGSSTRVALLVTEPICLDQVRSANGALGPVLLPAHLSTDALLRILVSADVPPPPDIVKTRCLELLTSVGFQSDLAGTHLLVEAVLLCTHHPAHLHQLVDCVYSQLASTARKSPQQVEQCIRYAISGATAKAPQLTTVLFGHKPTNGTVIALLAQAYLTNIPLAAQGAAGDPDLTRIV